MTLEELSTQRDALLQRASAASEWSKLIAAASRTRAIPRWLPPLQIWSAVLRSRASAGAAEFSRLIIGGFEAGLAEMLPEAAKGRAPGYCSGGGIPHWALISP